MRVLLYNVFAWNRVCVCVVGAGQYVFLALYLGLLATMLAIYERARWGRVCVRVCVCVRACVCVCVREMCTDAYVRVGVTSTRVAASFFLCALSVR